MLPKNYLHLIETHFPNLIWQSVKFVDKGWTNNIVILDNNIVFRFPKKEFTKKNLQNEIAILCSIKDRIDLSIPVYSYIPEDMSFGGYEIIKGGELKKMNTKQNFKEIATSIGVFLSQLHSIPISEIRGIGNKVSAHYTLDNGYINHTLMNFEKLEDKLHNGLYKKCVEFIQKSHPLKIENISLTHYDFQGKNIIFSPETHNIKGVIDFSESTIYDPAIDFSNLFVYGNHFVKEVLKNYSKKDGGILERASFFKKKSFIFSFPDLVEKTPKNFVHLEKELFNHLSGI